MNKQEKFEICKEVVEHWWTNLMLAHAELLIYTDIDSDSCEFCFQFDYCVRCPIKKFGGGCLKTYWHNISEFVCEHNSTRSKSSLKKVIHYTELFLKQLEEICDKWLNEKEETYVSKMA